LAGLAGFAFQEERDVKTETAEHAELAEKGFLRGLSGLCG